MTNRKSNSTLDLHLYNNTYSVPNVFYRWNCLLKIFFSFSWWASLNSTSYNLKFIVYNRKEQLNILSIWTPAKWHGNKFQHSPSNTWVWRSASSQILNLYDLIIGYLLSSNCLWSKGVWPASKFDNCWISHELFLHFIPDLFL